MPVVPDMADGRVERVLLRRKDWRRTLIWTMTPHGGCDLFNLLGLSYVRPDDNKVVVSSFNNF